MIAPPRAGMAFMVVLFAGMVASDLLAIDAYWRAIMVSMVAAIADSILRGEW